DELGITDRRGLNANIRTLYKLVRDMTPSQPSSYWLELCAKLDMPATPIVRLEDLPEHPQLKAVELFKTAEHPSEGQIPYVRPTTLLQKTPANVRRLAPHAGQHTRQILRAAGISDEQAEALIQAGVLKQADAALTKENN